MSEQDREQLRLWLRETDDEELNDFLEEDMDEETDEVLLPPNRPASPEFDNREFYIGKDKETRWYLSSLMARKSRTQRHKGIPIFHRPGP